VAWLSAAFKTLTLDVILPGQKFDIITAIDLDQLALTMVTQDQAFAPLTSSDFTLAQYKNPFGFSLQVVASGQDLLISDLGLDIATVRSLPTLKYVSYVRRSWYCLWPLRRAACRLETSPTLSSVSKTYH
jgi:hypothetical protein